MTVVGRSRDPGHRSESRSEKESSMSEQSNTMLTLAGLAGVVYLGHRWLTDKRGDEAETVVEGKPLDEPVSSPSHVEAKGRDGYLSRRFDTIFGSQGRGLPIAYLRALASRESDMKPDLATGQAWGLLQVEPIVLNDYN